MWLFAVVAGIWFEIVGAVKIAVAARFPLVRRGAIAQLGERIVRNDEVVGSIPTSSTNFFNHLGTF